MENEIDAIACQIKTTNDTLVDIASLLEDMTIALRHIARNLEKTDGA